jgi:8-oxo-dGTP pyrophosphatase MutT (NUDIX family)
MFQSFIYKLKEELQKELPGFASQKKMAPGFRPDLEPNKDTRKASVLILLFPQGNEIDTVFIKRPEYDGAHGGQISFPGGKVDDTDLDRIETALRETEEEIGVDRNLVKVLGTLTPLYIPVSDIEVLPVIGYTSSVPMFRPDKEEVDYTIVGSIQKLNLETNKELVHFNMHGHKFDAPVYKITPTEQVWGATAMMLSEFFDVVQKICPN